MKIYRFVYFDSDKINLKGNTESHRKQKASLNRTKKTNIEFFISLEQYLRSNCVGSESNTDTIKVWDLATKTSLFSPPAKKKDEKSNEEK